MTTSRAPARDDVKFRGTATGQFPIDPAEVMKKHHTTGGSLNAVLGNRNSLRQAYKIYCNDGISMIALIIGALVGKSCDGEA